MSGNLKGRPRKLPKLDELLADILGSPDGSSDDTSKAKEIIEALYKQAKKGNVGAASLLMDRAYGKAQQNIKLSGNVNSENKHVIEFVDNSKPKKG